MYKSLRLFLIIIINLSINNIHAQNIYGIKEFYDKLYPTSNYSPNNLDYTSCSIVGNRLSWILSSLLRMYETTGDKAYLIKFINHTIQIQNNRWDVRVSGDDPVWVRKNDFGDNCTEDSGYEPAYYNSLLIYPMAEFVNLVINEPGHELYNTNLPLQLINTLPSSPTILGYGDFANWLGKKVEETIFYMNNNYWDDSYGIKNHFSDGPDNGVFGAAMNMNSPYGSALLFMGLTNTNFGYGNNRANYLYKAQIIANLYKGDINIEDQCTCNLSGCEIYNHPVLRLMNNGTDSYFWYHAGWGLFKRDCIFHIPPRTNQPRILDYVKFVEDVSHGAMDLWFVKACYEAQLAPTNLSSPYFTSIEMERFKNTLTKNIYYTDNTGGHFHNAVNGTDNEITMDDPHCAPNCPTDIFWAEVLGWMPVYKFDGNSSPKAYDILLNHTVGLLQNTSTQNLGGAQSFLGLSEVVKAQWDKECINLTLYNREMVYDQDFFVKNNLVVAPALEDDFHELGDNSFADPIIQDNTFIIPTNVNVNMVAGESINLLPGFEAKSGSNFSASISPSACTDGKMVSSIGKPEINGMLNSKKEYTLMNSVEENIIQKIKIYPNPNDGIFNVSLPENFSSENISLDIYDNLGRLKFSQDKIPNTIDLSGYSNGIYFLEINTDQGIYREKIIKQ